MLTLLSFLIVTVIIVAILFAKQTCHMWSTCDTSPTMAFDGRLYRVHDEYKNSTKAAEILATIDKNIITLINHLTTKYKKDRTWRQNAIHRLVSRYETSDLVESAPLNLNGDTSYIYGKVHEFAICMRHPDGSFVDFNTIMFVVIHELAHISIDEYDHGQVFVRTNTWLLTEAIESGIYQYVDYAKNPTKYCGIGISHNLI